MDEDHDTGASGGTDMAAANIGASAATNDFSMEVTANGPTATTTETHDTTVAEPADPGPTGLDSAGAAERSTETAEKAPLSAGKLDTIIDAPTASKNLDLPTSPGFSASAAASVGAAVTAIAGAVKGGPAGWGVAAAATAVNNTNVQSSLAEVGKAISQGLADSAARTIQGSPEPQQSMVGFITDAQGLTNLDLPNAPNIPVIEYDNYTGHFSRPFDGFALVATVSSMPTDPGGGSSAGGG